MSLKAYRAKRSFDRTPEPEGDAERAHQKPIFVVQEHHARRLHYDFRLEADGVLKSWAVPKQPTLDPAQKRLAVQVEDHPLEYASFHGTIPAGEYGAGKVRIWDHGTYDNLMAKKGEPLTLVESIQAGHVEVALHGKKLRGNFALVHMKGRGRPGTENWLLIKMKDDKARPDGRADADPARTSKPRRAARKPAARAQPRRAAKPPGKFTEFTHTDKLMYPDDGITKGDVIAYYERVADRLIPFLRDRPVTLERYPDGIGGGPAAHFWQKNLADSAPDWVARAALETQQGKTVHYALVNNPATLLYLVNQGTLTFHVWLSRLADLDRPDFVLFDLDPGKASFADAVSVALKLHEALEEEGVSAFVKTSGKTGLHVLVPWKQAGGYGESRAWALAIAEQVAGALPEQATHEIRKAKRGKRVYIDVMQNVRGHHAVAPYVIRPVKGAPVSTPLEWDELKPSLDPAQFNINTTLRRFARQQRDPMARLVAAWKRSGTRKAQAKSRSGR